MIYSLKTRSLDWFSAILTFILGPALIILALFFVTSFTTNINQVVLIGIVIFVIVLFIFRYYRKNYQLLHTFATDTAYVHFKPSSKDLILGLYGQLFSILISIVIVLLFLSQEILTISKIDLFILSVVFSFILQIIQVFFMINSKMKLIDTAYEPVSQDLLKQLSEKAKDMNKIKRFYYADIKPASLFLTAGVTDYSFKSNICLISKYFQWKLSDTELLAVLGHEIGHVAHKDMLQSKILIDLQASARAFLFYLLLSILKNYFSSSALNINLIVAEVGVLILVILAQLFISFSLQLRMLNQEILADEYGSAIMGNYSLANTLKKLPSVIPAPVDDDPLQFLGFRVAILNQRGKNLGETDNSVREFSRFSNN